MYFSIRLRFSPSFDHSARIAPTLDTVSVWDGRNPALELMKVQCFCSENTHTHAWFPRPPALHRPQVRGVAKWIEMMLRCFFGQTRQHPIGGQFFLFFCSRDTTYVISHVVFRFLHLALSSICALCTGPTPHGRVIYTESESIFIFHHPSPNAIPCYHRSIWMMVGVLFNGVCRKKCVCVYVCEGI